LKLTDLAEQIGLSTKELKVKLDELGFGVKPQARTIEDDVAELVIAEFTDSSEGDVLADDGKEDDVAEVYDAIIHQEMEKEVVKSQRKKMAGKDDKKKKDEDEEEEASTPGKAIDIGDLISVKELAEKSGVNVAKIIGELMRNGILANINQQIDFETILIIAEDLGIKIKKKYGIAKADDILARNLDNLIKEEDEGVLKERPPVVVVMGHVDHGKTKLLDYIRKSDVVAGESGGITQHIAAYQVNVPAKDGKGDPRLVTFLDTPGHEAFTEMRARGAHVTDIAILIVAADEGIKPQTVEALNHAKEAGVPIIVAINKIDKPDVNIDKVKGELSDHDLQPEDWGGKTITVPISALRGDGIPELLDMILLVADMEIYKANPDRSAVCTVVEAHLDHSLGPVATILVNAGTLKKGDNFIVGSTSGKVKIMKDSLGKRIEAAGPSTPILVAGLNETPLSGDILQVVANEKEARQKSEEIIRAMENSASKDDMSNMNRLITHVQSNQIMKVVLKADTKGSLEAIKGSLAKIRDDEVAFKIIHSGVGEVSESDIMMASASKGLVLGFHVDFDSAHAKQTAERERVEVRRYKIIYELIDEVKNVLSGLLEPEIVVEELGKVAVQQIFWTKKKEMIIGCKVINGKITKDSLVKIHRGEEILAEEQKLVSLQRGENSVNEVKEGEECGIKYDGKVKLEEGDIFEAYRRVEKHRKLGDKIEREEEEVVEDEAAGEESEDSKEEEKTEET
jgi:translation initiation factor IF-2